MLRDIRVRRCGLSARSRTRGRARAVLIWTSWVPPALWLATVVYLRQYDGWGLWAAAPLLLPAVLMSLGLGLAGLAHLILDARRAAGLDRPLLGATLLSSSLILYVLVRNLMR